MALEGCRVTICNRTGSRARELAAEVAVGVPESEARSVEFSRSCLEAVLHRSDILVNATPVGMYPENDRSIVSPTMLHRDLAVMDLVYNPPRTQLLRDAEKAGCKAIGGLGMLVYQAAESICIWTGLRAPTVTMMVEAERALMAYQSP